MVSQRVSAARRLALSDRGLSIIAHRDRASVGIARKRWSAEAIDANASFGWRNIRGTRTRQLLRHLDHTETVHQIIAALSEKTGADSMNIGQLDPPHRASRYFRRQGHLHSIHPDAFVSLETDSGVHAYFLEYERRAVRPSTMLARLAPYLHYYATRRPLEDHGILPNLLVVFDEDLAATHFRRVAERHGARAERQVAAIRLQSG